MQVLLFYVLEYNVDKLFIENLGSQKCGRHLFNSRPKLLTLSQILWHYAGRAFKELSHVCFGFILAIIGIALDRNKWRSVISPKISIFFKFDPIWPLKYWPKVTKIAHHKVHWHVFSSLTKFGDSSSYRSWDSREGQNLPPPFPGRVILRPFPVRVLSKQTNKYLINLTS